MGARQRAKVGLGLGAAAAYRTHVASFMLPIGMCIYMHMHMHMHMHMRVHMHKHMHKHMHMRCMHMRCMHMQHARRELHAAEGDDAGDGGGQPEVQRSDAFVAADVAEA